MAAVGVEDLDAPVLTGPELAVAKGQGRGLNRDCLG